MKIVSRTTLMGLPAGTVYCEYSSAFEFGTFRIKDHTIYDEGEPLDWYHSDSIFGWPSDLYMATLGESEADTLCLDSLERDGMFSERQLYAVLEPADLNALIARLQQAALDCAKGGAQ